MARKSVLVSDLSGQEIEEGKGAQVTIQTGTDRYELDLTLDEVESLTAVGRKVAKRGRKPKAQAA